MVCGNCGGDVDDGVRFCPNCGAPVQAGTAPAGRLRGFPGAPGYLRRCGGPGLANDFNIVGFAQGLAQCPAHNGVIFSDC